VGDSGSPLVATDASSRRAVLLGLATFADGSDCKTDDPVGFADVSAVSAWVRQVVGAGECAEWK